MPGFASTADFFEAHAKREREHERRQRLLEAAGFYRSLAEIIPGIPARSPITFMTRIAARS